MAKLAAEEEDANSLRTRESRFEMQQKVIPAVCGGANALLWQYALSV